LKVSCFSVVAALKFCFKTCAAMKFVDDDDDDDGWFVLAARLKN